MNKQPQLRTYSKSNNVGSGGLLIKHGENGVLSHDIVMGARTMGPSRYGILGRTSEHGRVVAGDMHLAHAHIIIGSPGSGKSMMSQVLLEMALQKHPTMWHGERQMAAAAFHFARDEEYHAEFPSMRLPNDDSNLVKILRESYAATPLGHADVMVIAPSIMVGAREKIYGSLGVPVMPFLFNMNELEADHLKLLIGAYGDASASIMRMNHLIWKETERQKTTAPIITLDQLETWMLESTLPLAVKDEISMRISVARLFIHDGPSLRSYMKPGRLLVFDMRCKAITAEQTFALGVVALQTLAAARAPGGENMSKLILVDEAHNVMTPQAQGITNVLLDKTRTRRHQLMTLALSTQDPMGLNPLQIEMSDHLQIFRSDTSTWLERIGKHCMPFSTVDPYDIQSLETGECLMWSNKSTETDFTRTPLRLQVRPSLSKPGGATLTDTGVAVGH